MEVVEILQRLRELGYSNEQATALLKLQLEERQQQRQLQEQQQRWLLEERQQQFNFELQMAQVKAQSKCKGVTTEAQFFQDLQDKNLITHDANAWETIFSGNLPDEDISLSLLRTYEGLPIHAQETSQVQPFMSELLAKVLDGNPQYWVDPQSHKHPTFGTRKPDNVVYKSGCSGYLAIVVFGENKGRYSNKDFNAQHCGHLLDMARELMTDFQPRRPFIYCFLTDGYRFRFFRVYRDALDGDVRYDMSRIYIGRLGLQNLLVLLRRQPGELGHFGEPVDNWTRLSVLGRGGQAVVYAVQRSGDRFLASASAAASLPSTPAAVTNAVMKEFGDENARDQEMANLQLLNSHDIPGVPAFLEAPQTTSGIFTYMVYTPVGQPVLPCAGGRPTRARHYLQLLQTVRSAHMVANIVHRDIKPENVFLIRRGSNEELMLNDWGSATSLRSAVATWQGTRTYYTVGEPPNPSADLRALVRTIYVLYFKGAPPGTTDEAKIAAFWTEQFSSESLWTSLLACAEQCDYDKMDRMLHLL